MDREKLWQQILLHAGGEENISSRRESESKIFLCVKDESCVRVDLLQTMDGVAHCALHNGQVRLFLETEENNVAKNYKAMAEQILSAAGGKENITRAFSCATRLRLEIKDLDRVERDTLKKISGVAGINFVDHQLQIIIGTDVGSLLAELNRMAKFEQEAGSSGSGKPENVISIIAGIFTPLLPAIIGGGMVKAILAVISAFSLMDTASQTYTILSLIGDAAFYFLPFLVAYTSSKKFQTNTALSMTLAGVLMYPTLATLGSETGSVAFFGIPVVSATYSSSVIPIILTVWMQSYLEKIFEHVWKPIRSFLKPTLTLLVAAPIMLIVIGPLGTWCGGILSAILETIDSVAPWLPTVVMGAFSPLIVMTGMHYSLMPLAVSQVTTLGYITIDLPGMLAANVAQGGAALAVAFKTKNFQLRQIAASSGLTAVLGITEPAMYGVNLKLKKPFYAVMLGGAAGGLFAGITGLKAYAPGSPGLATLPLFMGGENPMSNLLLALGTVAVAFAVSFAATLLLGFEDEIET